MYMHCVGIGVAEEVLDRTVVGCVDDEDKNDLFGFVFGEDEIDDSTEVSAVMLNL